MGTVLIRSETILGAQLGENDLALLSTKTSRYYGLDGPGARTWELLATPISIGVLCKALQAEFDVAPDVCQRDILELLEQLIAEDLVSVVAKEK